MTVKELRDILQSPESPLDDDARVFVNLDGDCHSIKSVEFFGVKETLPEGPTDVEGSLLAHIKAVQ